MSSCRVGCGGCKTSVMAGGFGGGGVGAWEGAAGAEDRPVCLTGVSGLPRSWSFWRARASSSLVFLRARRAEPSAGAGE